MKKLLIAAALMLSFNAIAGNIFTEVNQSDHKVLTDKVVSPSNFYTNENSNNFQKVNMSCGLAPLPPLGCTVGACMCDQNGRNCQWTFNCR